MASKSKRKRNYAKEYLIRIARGLTGGKSRAQARGHARATDLADQSEAQPFKQIKPARKRLEADEAGRLPSGGQQNRSAFLRRPCAGFKS